MTTVDHLNARIQSAKRTHAPRSVAQHKADASRLNPKLEVLAQSQHITASGTVDEIFPCEDRVDNRTFEFEIITNGTQLNVLKAQLKKMRDRGEDWPFADWLDGAHEDGDTILTVRRTGDRKPAGFTNIRTSLRLEDHSDEDTSKPVIYLNIALDAIYISPSERGEGHSQALSWAIARLANDIAYDLAEWNDPERERLEKYPVEISITGEAHSEGGARFLSRTIEKIESHMDQFDPKTTWDFVPTVTDRCDFSDYPNGGYTLTDRTL